MPVPRLIVPGLYELELPIPLGTVNVFFILTAGGVTLIDTGYPDRGRGVLAGLHALGRAITDVRHIIVTHHHVDHAGNVATLQAQSDAQVWMHPLDAEQVARGQALRPTAHSAQGWFNQLAFGVAKWLMPTTITPTAIDRQVTDNDVIPIAGGFKVIHIPGHSAGQIGLYWPAQQTLFVADAVMHRGKSLQAPIILEEEAVAAASLQRLDRYTFTTLCFGHGQSLTETAAATFHRYISMNAS
ncbi:MBL fold metallo-hydrolase [Chloroflexus sp.]|uniref:MBL fold metallo-hydrolase n=1 Tax=Chloroflexus sp. TaxID=1904827 RepID=UPI00261A06DB|nr:MBL fold metallo-hydrolase [uncultured Chloroflexus sp.]